MQDFFQLPTNHSNAVYEVYVDNESWGYTDTVADAKQLVQMIADNLSKEISKSKPWLTVCTIDDTVSANSVRVQTVHPGYVYTSKHIAHVVRYESIFKLLVDAPEENEDSIIDLPPPPAPPPPPPPAPPAPLVPKHNRRRYRRYKKRH